MSLPYHLDLALGLVCLLALVGYAAFTVLPLILGRLFGALVRLGQDVHTQLGRASSTRRALPTQDDEPWWGRHSSP